MDAQQKVDAINKYPIGTNVVYWPRMHADGVILHKQGKRTRIRHAAYIDSASQPVIFVEGIAGCVHVDHIEIGSIMDSASKSFSQEFIHLW